MAFRKQDLLRPHVALSLARPWSETVKKTTPVQQGERFTLHVSYPEERCEDRSESQLDPSLVTMHTIIESGAFIDPTSAMNILQTTDVAELEQYREQFGEDMVKYLQENKDELLKTMNHED